MSVIVSKLTGQSVQMLCDECEGFEIIISPDLADQNSSHDLILTVQEFKVEHKNCNEASNLSRRHVPVLY